MTWIRSKFSADGATCAVAAVAAPFAISVVEGKCADPDNVLPTLADFRDSRADLSKVGGQVSASPEVEALQEPNLVLQLRKSVGRMIEADFYAITIALRRFRLRHRR